VRRPGCSGACSNNTRWLILARVRLLHLSSQVLSRITRRLSRPSFKDLIGCLRETLAGFYDRRTGDNCSCAMEDFGLSAFAVFFTQAPSFLAHQKAMQTARGANKPLPPPLIPIPAQSSLRSAPSSQNGLLPPTRWALHSECSPR